MQWIELDSGRAKAQALMDKDLELLLALEKEAKPILHFYEWEGPSATHGYFVDPKDFFHLQEVGKKGLSLARRPTGGGIIFHIWDFAFSVLVPSSSPAFSQNTLENYAFINQAVLEAVKAFHQKMDTMEIIPEDLPSQEETCRYFCMAKPTKYDVVFQQKKIAGAAQRKTRFGYLHQGSISLCMPDKEYLEAVLLPDTKVIDSMFAYSFPLLGKDPTEQDLADGRLKMKELLKKFITRDE